MYKPPCSQNPEMFFPDEHDGRKETDRREREDACRAMCFGCRIRLDCLYIAVSERRIDGVWGAMGEGERRFFMIYLRRKGYKKTPTGQAFHQELESYYKQRQERRRKMRGT